ncbi:hypothetical protein PPERSA_04640 [Pseudocohnilembus persalinus]|uniref:MORN motif n=1 Tax=Pseudocohnilembus persalinus TaxID=266149 RepID=A0A0V0QPB5_PSEPJ|nr:hypothetical protein PPERSA_04640 [Pseudocohnilembus persalinus]|eukprot:KRX03845.1 hypothetical protein PPERSA_04640 [Pseudocohnilembus persalinus]
MESQNDNLIFYSDIQKQINETQKEIERTRKRQTLLDEYLDKERTDVELLSKKQVENYKKSGDDLIKDVANYYQYENSFLQPDEKDVVPLIHRLAQQQEANQLNNMEKEKQSMRVYDNGQKYIGQIKDGLRQGVGCMFYANGMKQYEGYWKNDKIEGFGKFYYPDGTRYVGNFHNWLWHGNGTYYDRNNKIVHTGVYEMGKWISQINEMSKLYLQQSYLQNDTY